MNQSLNILRKDARQLKFEILASLTVLVLFVAFEPKSWIQMGPLLLVLPSSADLGALLFASWGVLVIRLVQSERLVGLNQFWTTRPYEWRKLVAAKVLFLLLILYLPLVLSQLFLLWRAHLPIIENIPLLLLNLFLLTAIFVLPFICFAALTTSFAQSMLALLGTVVLCVVILSFDTPRFKELAPQSLPPLQYAILAAGLSAALLYQYRYRRRLHSLAIALLAPILVLLTQLTIPGTSLAVRSYNPSGNQPISIHFDDNPVRKFGRIPKGDPKEMLFLHLPLLTSQINPGISFARDGEKITLTGADGYTWRSTWMLKDGIFAPDAFARQTTTYTEFFISREVYDRLATGPVTIGIEFALQQIEDEPPIKETLSTTGDWIPDLGFCALDESYGTVHCRSAFREPNYFAIETVRKMGPCTASTDDTEPAHAFVGDTRAAPLALHLSPVVVTGLQFSVASQSTGPLVSAYLCPGAPIAFIRKSSQHRFRAEMPPATIYLKDYVGTIHIR